MGSGFGLTCVSQRSSIAGNSEADYSGSNTRAYSGGHKMFAEIIRLLSSHDQHVCVYLDGDPITPPG